MLRRVSILCSCCTTFDGKSLEVAASLPRWNDPHMCQMLSVGQSKEAGSNVPWKKFKVWVSRLVFSTFQSILKKYLNFQDTI